MRSMWQILSAVIDGDIATKDDAAAVLEDEAREYADVLKLSQAEASKMLRENIGYCAYYYTQAQAERILDLFDAEHPIFGRSWPTPEDAVRLSHEHALERMKDGA